MSETNGRPVIFGEVLYDRFPDGRSVAGGAPFNVAWNLAALGYDPLFVSRVGDDTDGRALLDAMHKAGMSLDGMQVDATLPTGEVKVTLGGGGPSYEIVFPSAWDAIDRDQTLAAVGAAKPSLIYHGTLALRHETSLNALNLLRNAHRTVAFVDLNLRAPWWKPARYRTSGGRRQSCETQRRRAGQTDRAPLRHRRRSSQGGRKLFRRMGIRKPHCHPRRQRSVDGRCQRGPSRPPPPKPHSIVDTVGAGDAFASVMIAGILSGWEMRRSLARAGDFASAVVGLAGATNDQAAFYEPFRRQWSDQ